MSDSRRHVRLALILPPSPPLPVLSDSQSRPQSRDSASIKGGHSRHSLVKTLRRSLEPFTPAPTMHPPLSGPASSDLLLTVFPQTGSRFGPSMPQPPRGRPHTTEGSRSRPRTTSNQEKKGTALPKPKRLSPDLFVSTPTDVKNNPRTLRNRRRVKHRGSVDVTSPTGWVTSADGLKAKQDPEPSDRSMWSHKRGQASLDSDEWDREARFGSTNAPLDPLPEKQRVMNVRRAKKMQKVFGSEPPRSLFQTAHMPPVPDLESDMDGMDGFDDRASVSTLLSTSTLNLQSLMAASGRQRPASTSIPRLVGPTPPTTSTTPVLAPLKFQRPLYLKIERSITHDPPMESPPFSQVFCPYIRRSAVRSGTPKPLTRTETSGKRKEKEFRQRRMRAAKLSKFFGVDYQDLEPHLGPAVRKADVKKVEVAIDDRGALPWDRHEFRSLEMEDVIVKLRDLRSS